MPRIASTFLIGLLSACASAPESDATRSVATRKSGLRRVVVHVDRLE